MVDEAAGGTGLGGEWGILKVKKSKKVQNMNQGTNSGSTDAGTLRSR